MFYVTVKSEVQFDREYHEKIAEAYKSYSDWLIENIGHEVPYEQSYISYESTVYFKFEFENEEDAMAFKLRWL